MALQWWITLFSLWFSQSGSESSWYLSLHLSCIWAENEFIPFSPLHPAMLTQTQSRKKVTACYKIPINQDRLEIRTVWYCAGKPALQPLRAEEMWCPCPSSVNWHDSSAVCWGPWEHSAHNVQIAPVFLILVDCTNISVTWILFPLCISGVEWGSCQKCSEMGK